MYSQIASTGLLLRDTERVVRYGKEALAVAVGSGSGAVRRKLMAFRRSLGHVPEHGSTQDLGRRTEALEDGSHRLM